MAKSTKNPRMGAGQGLGILLSILKGNGIPLSGGGRSR